MRRLWVLLLVLALLPGCASGGETQEAGGREVVASISILADFVRAVGGEDVSVETIVHIGGDPHTYEPTPSDARKVAAANTVFRNGLGLERWLDRLIEGGGRPVVTLTDGLDPLIQESGTYSGDPDPHLWMDPELAAGYVDNAERALVDLNPSGADGYRRNAESYRRELRELDGWIREQIETIPPDQRKLVTTHDAFRYFGDRYGLEVVGTIWSISTEREPSADEIRVLVDSIRRESVKAVFVETTINPRVMQRVATDAGVTVGRPLYGDSVGEPGSGAETYIGMMRANVRSITEALGGTVAAS